MLFTAPNWREESAYPRDSDNCSLSFWAWQFLRRNCAYQADWRELAEEMRLKAKSFPTLAGMLENDTWRYSRPDEAVGVITVNNLLPQMQVSQLAAEACIRSQAAAFAKKWGIEKIVSPMSSDMPHWSGFDTDGGRINILTVSVPDYRDENYLVPQIDLRYPVEVLEAQFKAILAERTRLIKHGRITPYTGRPQRARHLYPNYLRVLDALSGNETIAEIASVLLPHQDTENSKKTIQNWKNAAIKIRENTYRLLPAYQILKERKRSKNS